MKAYEAQAREVMEERQEKRPSIAKILDEWAEEMVRCNIGVQGYPRQSTVQTARDMNYDADQDGKCKRDACPKTVGKKCAECSKFIPIPPTGLGLPTGPQRQTRTRKGPAVHISEKSVLIETSIIHVCRYRPDLLRVIRAEYLNIVPHQGKLVRRPRDHTKTLTEYRTAMAPKLGISERRWRQLLSEAHTAIACLLSLFESGFTDVESVRKQMRRDWVTLWAVRT